MIEHKGDLWEHFGEAGHRIAITTNGSVKHNGEAVMGRGCALEATKRFKGVAHNLGSYIKMEGNVPGYIFLEGGTNPANDRLMILPVKHNWWEKADLDLINRSLLYLHKQAVDFRDWTFHVPRLGCGNGKLDWDTEVKLFMVSLPDNVVVHSKG